MKLSKKQKKFALFIILGIIVFIVLGVSLNLNKTFSLFTSGSDFMDEYASVVSRDSYSITYNFGNSVIGENWKFASCNNNLDSNGNLIFNVSISYGGLDSVSGSTSSTAINNWLDLYSPQAQNIQDKWFKASESKISFGARVNPCSGISYGAGVKLENLTTYCNGFNCWFSGIAYPIDGSNNKIIGPGVSMYLSSGTSVVVTELKEGIQCTQSQTSLCSENQECVSNTCQEQKISVYRFENNTCTFKAIAPSERTTNDYNTSTECLINVIPEPPTPPPGGWFSWLIKLNEWIQNFFRSLLGLSIAGAVNIEPNTIQTYQIDLTAPVPDSDFSDGKYQVQYGNWALIDSSNNIKQQGTWEEVKGRYTKSVTITTPSNIGDFMFVGMITQFDGVYNYQTKTWTWSEEMIINKEGINLQNKYIIEDPTNPLPGGFAKFIQAIRNFFCGAFGWFCSS